MRRILIYNLDRPEIAPVESGFADSFISKLRGLTFRRQVSSNEGLLLVQGRDSRIDSSIHMLGVFTDLAVVWINQDKVVVDVCLARSWRPVYIPKAPARYVLEMHPVRLQDFQVGDRVKFHERS
jgi:uncharacterized membrane protein (UPF0127 family)